MATIIDCTPSAADATQHLNAIPPQQLSELLGRDIPAYLPRTDIAFNRDAGNDFHKNAPDLLFVAEYVHQNDLLGALIVWEDYFGATHYEVHRRDILSAYKDWERILFIDQQNLVAETKQYLPYINDVLRISQGKAPFYAILDTDIKTDKMYEYKITAGYYPNTARIDYATVLKSKGLVNYIPIKSPTTTLRQFAGSALGNEEYAWIVSALNIQLPYLGSNYDSMLIWNTAPANKELMVPKDPNDLVRIVAESIHMFGSQQTIKNFLLNLRESPAGAIFDALVVQAVDDKEQTLSWDKLNNLVMKEYPNYKTLSEKTAQGASTTSYLSDLHIIKYTGKATFDSIGQLTLMVLRLNTLLTIAQDVTNRTTDLALNTTITSRTYNK